MWLATFISEDGECAEGGRDGWLRPGGGESVVGRAEWRGWGRAWASRAGSEVGMGPGWPSGDTADIDTAMIAWAWRG